MQLVQGQSSIYPVGSLNKMLNGIGLYLFKEFALDGKNDFPQTLLIKLGVSREVGWYYGASAIQSKIIGIH